MKLFKRLCSILLACCLITALFPASFSAADDKTVTARTMSIVKLEGSTTTVLKGKKSIPATEGLKLSEQYSVSTGNAGRAYLQIDDDKFISLDINTSVSITKANSKKLLLTLTEGTIFFDVQKKLNADETMAFLAGGTTMSIRGTAGTITLTSEEALISLFEGALEAGRRLNPSKITIYANQQIDFSKAQPVVTPISAAALSNFEKLQAVNLAPNRISEEMRSLLLDDFMLSDLKKKLKNVIIENEKALQEAEKTFDNSRLLGEGETEPTTPVDPEPPTPVAPEQSIPVETIKAIMENMTFPQATSSSSILEADITKSIAFTPAGLTFTARSTSVQYNLIFATILSSQENTVTDPLKMLSADPSQSVRVYGNTIIIDLVPNSYSTLFAILTQSSNAPYASSDYYKLSNIRPIYTPPAEGSGHQWYGSGTVADPYLIENFTDLMRLSRLSMKDNFEGIYFKQTADIDISTSAKFWDFEGGATSLTTGISWVPIGYEFPFMGTYDGGSHTVINNSSSVTGPLFYALGGNVSNLTLKKIKSNDGGALAKYIGGQGGSIVISNVLVTESSSYIEGGNAGGIASSATNTTFSNCTVSSSQISVTSGGAGGIVGETHGNISITNSKVLSTTFALDNSSISVGAGYVPDAGIFIGMATTSPEPVLSGNYNASNVGIAGSKLIGYYLGIDAQ